MSARFEMLEIPGSGAHATVCIVRDHHHGGARRALKVLREDFDAESAEARRVRDEGRILQRIRHPSLPRVYERLELGGRQVLVMDALEGPSLAAVVRQQGALPVGVAAMLLAGVASAVHAAYTSSPADGGHPARLVHRDLNLANIVVEVDGTVRVLDFGLARAEFLDREAVTMISLLGTPGYTAPEGLRAIQDNPGLDVYSLGICAVALLGGYVPILSRKPPRHRSGLQDVLAKLEEKGIPEGVRVLVGRMCAHDPSARPTMGEVGRALEEWCEPEAFAGWIQQVVVPLHESRKRLDPLLHQAYPQLAFLEGVTLGAQGDPSPAERADHLVRRFLTREDWAGRTQDLKWVLSRHPAWSAAPFLEVLEPLSVSWWRRPRRPASREVAVAVCALSHRPSQEVYDRVRPLERHRHPFVSELARAVGRGEELSLDRIEAHRWSK